MIFSMHIVQIVIVFTFKVVAKQDYEDYEHSGLDTNGVG